METAMKSRMYGSSKRAKAPGNIIQGTYCLVDGCSSDLSQCREYHRRHKVCESHSKTTKVTIGGREQRFCQQCSRFHSLIEFNEGKRSCRKSLDRHNSRRRKPQLGSVSRNPEPLIYSQQGVQILSFLESFTSSIVSSICNEAVNADKNLLAFSNQKDSNYIIVRQNSSSEASSQNNIVNHLQFLPTMESMIPNTSIQQSFNPNSALANFCCGQKMESDCFDHVVDSDLLSPFCHWSLLS